MVTAVRAESEEAAVAEVGELRRAHDALAELQRCVEGVAERWGDSMPVRRLREDARRVGEDLAHLGAPPAPRRPAAPLEIVPDGDYAVGFWGDADEEGLGHSRA